MSKRRTVLQLDDHQPSHGSPSSRQHDRIPTPDSDDNDGDAAGDMPTPERLVTPDMMPPKSELDNKVANFLAEIDALDNEDEDEDSPVPMTSADREEEAVPRFQVSPARDNFTAPESRDTTPPPPASSRSTSNAYSNMFVKGTPEFTKKPDEKRNDRDRKTELEPWPEEPKTDWQQLIDESTKYPYYWNMSTNEVVWDIPAEFSAYLLRQKEYEEKVERGLREGKLDPSERDKQSQPRGDSKEDNKGKEASTKMVEKSKESTSTKSEKSSRSTESQGRRYASDSEDSSSDSSDSDVERPRARKSDNSVEVPSSSTSLLDKDTSYKKKVKNSEGPAHVLPDSTEAVSKHERKSRRKSSSSNEDAADFDIDDIDKELELALERKKKEHPKAEDKKKGDGDKEKHKDKERRKDYKHRSDDRREDRTRHGEERRKHKHKDHDRDRDRDRKHHSREEKEEKPKLTLKERLRIEMELKLEKERRKKKAIEEMMNRELEKTVAGSRSQKRHRDDRDEPRKRDRYTRDEEESRSRDQFSDIPLRRGYDAWDRDRRAPSFEERLGGGPYYKPPPPTEEMVAYKERSGSEVMDYAHGSGRLKGLDGDDGDDIRPADQREIEMKKLEALQLAELALSKLEFLEVTKKGLSKLQILLIELETRHQDWQAGGLTTHHFLEKLRGANWQLEQYEGSAAPNNWVCSWDRDYRRYFYTHKHTGKTQWDYPDTEDIMAEEVKMKQKGAAQKRTDPEPEISSSSDRIQTFTGMETDLPSDILANVALPPPPPPPAEEHPSVKSLMLSYGSTSESEGEEQETARAKKKQKTDPEPPPPLPPLPAEKPPVQDTEERKDRHERHKKKKKKEKSKKKEKMENAVVTTVGPMLPAAPVPIVASSVAQSTVYPGQEITYPNNQPPPPGEAYYPQPMVASTEVPVYGSVSVPEMYGQNDQPLEFGMGPEAMDITGGGEPGQVVTEISQQPQVMHPPEVYAASSTVGQYATPGESAETVEGSSVSDTPATLIQNPEEKKKKKKSEKMGSANISLKKKHVSSMVQKWQKVKKEVELEERDRAIREAEIRKKLAELE